MRRAVAMLLLVGIAYAEEGSSPLPQNLRPTLVQDEGHLAILVASDGPLYRRAKGVAERREASDLGFGLAGVFGVLGAVGAGASNRQLAGTGFVTAGVSLLLALAFRPWGSEQREIVEEWNAGHRDQPLQLGP